jgi:hypothetical protein
MPTDVEARCSPPQLQRLNDNCQTLDAVKKDEEYITLVPRFRGYWFSRTSRSFCLEIFEFSKYLLTTTFYIIYIKIKPKGETALRCCLGWQVHTINLGTATVISMHIVLVTSLRDLYNIAGLLDIS